MTLVARALRIPILAAGIVTSVGSTQALSPQEPDPLRGRVMDAAGQSLAGIAVVLHRVTREGGAEVGRAISDAEGQFEIAWPAGGEEAVYFAAARHEGALYFGEPFRGPVPPDAVYVLVIGPSTAMPMPSSAQSRPASDPLATARWAVPGLLVLMGMLAITRPWWRGGRKQGHRKLLVELATLEEAWAAGDPALQEAVYRRRREELRSRLLHPMDRAVPAGAADDSWR